MTLLLIIAACLVAEVLLLSAGHKILRRGEYLAALRSYRRLRALSPAQRFAASWLVPATEAAIAGLVLIPETRASGLAAAGAAFVTFYVVVGSDDRPVIANCGCWGRASFGVSRRAVLARNLVLTLISGGASAVAWSAGAAAGRGGLALGTAAAAGMALPFAVLLLEFPDLLMLATIRPAGNR